MFTLRCRTSLARPQTPPNSCAAQSIEAIIDLAAWNHEPSHAQATDITTSSSAGVDPLRTCNGGELGWVETGGEGAEQVARR